VWVKFLSLWRGEGRERVTRIMAKEAWFEKEGYAVVRFWDNEVLTNTSGVLEVLREKLYRTPSPQGRGTNKWRISPHQQ
jgi:very-short-patch-repair endonuclease